MVFRLRCFHSRMAFLRYSFLVACTQLYKSLCRSVRRSVRPSVRPSPVIFRRVLGAPCAGYPALFFLLFSRLQKRSILLDGEKHPSQQPVAPTQSQLAQVFKYFLFGAGSSGREHQWERHGHSHSHNGGHHCSHSYFYSYHSFRRNTTALKLLGVIFKRHCASLTKISSLLCLDLLE